MEIEDIKDFKDRELFYKQEIRYLKNIIDIQNKMIASRENMINFIDRMHRSNLQDVEKMVERIKKVSKK